MIAVVLVIWLSAGVALGVLIGGAVRLADQIAAGQVVL